MSAGLYDSVTQPVLVLTLFQFLEQFADEPQFLKYYEGKGRSALVNNSISHLRNGLKKAAVAVIKRSDIMTNDSGKDCGDAVDPNFDDKPMSLDAWRKVARSYVLEHPAGHALSEVRCVRIS